jgi:hypothetical protein
MKKILSSLFFLCSIAIFAQTSDILLDSRYHHLIDRSDIKNPYGFTTVKPYSRADIIQRISQSTSDSLNINYLKLDNYLFLDSIIDYKSEKPILKHFYTNKPDAFAVQTEDFKLTVNPMYDIKLGNNTNKGERTFLNTRGLEVKGVINQKIGFYSMLADNQGRFGDYANNEFVTVGAVSGENFWKSYKKTGFDFFTAKGYLTFAATKNIKLKFGYDKNFIGDGYRSLILSDYAGNYTHLRIDTKIWKLNYTNIFADMTADYNYGIAGTSGARNFPRKFVTIHHLGINLRKNLNLGLFESIIQGGADSTGVQGIDLNFMNPVIFYRAIESNLGSGGNAILGANFKWNFLRHFSLYGQFVLDEFLFEHVKSQDGWWANKYGAQLGTKYIDIAGIEGLDLQLEFNAVRPFTYSHTTKNGSYSHFNQSLAHPLGANFVEKLAIVRYQPHARVFLTLKYFNIEKGLDQNGENYGGNILLPNSTRFKRPQEIGHNILQGDKTKTSYLGFTAQYMIAHNLFIEMDLVHRKSSNSKNKILENNLLNLGLRMNLAQRNHEF